MSFIPQAALFATRLGVSCASGYALGSIYKWPQDIKNGIVGTLAINTVIYAVAMAIFTSFPLPFAAASYIVPSLLFLITPFPSLIICARAGIGFRHHEPDYLMLLGEVTIASRAAYIAQRLLFG